MHICAVRASTHVYAVFRSLVCLYSRLKKRSSAGFELDPVACYKSALDIPPYGCFYELEALVGGS